MTAQEHTDQLLDKMIKGDQKEVEKVAPKDPQLFIKCVKNYIDRGGRIEFNKSYTKFRKY